MIIHYHLERKDKSLPAVLFQDCDKVNCSSELLRKNVLAGLNSFDTFAGKEKKVERKKSGIAL